MPSRTWTHRSMLSSQTGNSTGGASPVTNTYYVGNCSSVTQSNGKNWRQLLLKVPVLTGPLTYSGTIYQVQPSYQSVSVQSKTGSNPPVVTYWSRGDSSGFEDSWRLSTGDLVASADAIAAGRIVDRHLKSIQDVQSGPIIGELGETLSFLNKERRNLFQLFTTPLRRYPGAVRRFMKQRKGYRTRDFLRWSSNYWLKWRFAMLPLVSDANALADAFNKDAKRFETEWIISRSVGESKRAYSGPVYLSGSSNMRFTTGYRETATATVKYRGAVVSKGQGSQFKRFGLTAEEFLPSVWEVIPYSWLIDYATNTGDVIRTWSYRGIFDGGLQRTSAVVQVGEIYGRRDVSKEHLSPSLNLISSSFNPGMLRKTTKSIQRFRVSKLNTPNLTFKVPKAPSLQDLRWVNVAAFLIPKLIQRCQLANRDALKGAR